MKQHRTLTDSLCVCVAALLGALWLSANAFACDCSKPRGTYCIAECWETSINGTTTGSAGGGLMPSNPAAGGSLIERPDSEFWMLDPAVGVRNNHTFDTEILNMRRSLQENGALGTAGN